MKRVDVPINASGHHHRQAVEARDLSFSPTNAKQAHDARLAADEIEKNGHLTLRGVATEAEISIHRRIIHRSVDRLTTEHRHLDERDTYGKAFLQITNLWTKDQAVERFVFEKRFAQIAADLLGVERVRLYHDQALFKEPGGGRTPWHQDKYYWPLDTDKTITMWMPLVDIKPELGIITFASGSHTASLVDNVDISDESEKIFAQYVEDRGLAISTPDSMKAGDATFHLGGTIHSAGPNLSDRMREVMTIIYFSDGARVTKPNSEHQQADLDAWLDGKLPGELADGPLNPLLN
jgi:ectoine hydroxylase-related dioxygenase (phytanoyl-CoA dioxygenase family)